MVVVSTVIKPTFFFSDFVIVSPKNPCQRVMLFSDTLPSTLSECKLPCSKLAYFVDMRLIDGT